MSNSALVEWGIDIESQDAMEKLRIFLDRTSEVKGETQNIGKVGGAAFGSLIRPLDSVIAKLTGVNASALRLGTSLGKLGGPLAAIGIGAAVAAVGIVMKSLNETTKELDATQKEVDATYQRLHDTLVGPTTAAFEALQRELKKTQDELDKTQKKSGGFLLGVANALISFGGPTGQLGVALFNKLSGQLKEAGDNAKTAGTNLKLFFDTLRSDLLAKANQELAAQTTAFEGVTRALISQDIAIRDGDRSAYEYGLQNQHLTQTQIDYAMSIYDTVQADKELAALRQQGSADIVAQQSAFTGVTQALQQQIIELRSGARAAEEFSLQIQGLNSKQIAYDLHLWDIAHALQEGKDAAKKFAEAHKKAAEEFRQAWLRALSEVQTMIHNVFGDSGLGKGLSLLAGVANIAAPFILKKPQAVGS